VGVTVAPVEWFDEVDDRQAIQITVSDEGVGLSESEQRSAFSDFVQGDGSDTRRFGGLGLGLSLVKRVAEAHGGTVELVSTPRKGSRFSIILPVLSTEPDR
jgi:signal transduction histidine kinase